MFAPGANNRASATNAQFQYPVNGVDPTFFTSPQQGTPANAFSGGSLDESPFVDYLDGDNSFDFDNADDDLMIGSLPGGSPDKNGEDSNEKRKSPDDDDADNDEGGGKRREGEDKQAKKPGRKPLTSEPTTVGSSCRVSPNNTDRSAETQGTEPSRPASVPGEEGEASQGPRDQSAGA